MHTEAPAPLGGEDRLRDPKHSEAMSGTESLLQRHKIPNSVKRPKTPTLLHKQTKGECPHSNMPRLLYKIKIRAGSVFPSKLGSKENCITCLALLGSSLANGWNEMMQFAL